MTKRQLFEHRDFHAIHEAALKIHQSDSLSSACRSLADTLLEIELVRGFRASIGIGGPSPRSDLLVAPDNNRFDADDDAHLADFVIELPTGDRLRIEIALPFGSCVRDQSLVEILLEHLCAASRWLPLYELPPEPALKYLTRREREVLPHILAGYTNASIASLLGISPRTVEKHVTSILRKFDCDSRISLIANEFRTNE